MEEKSKLDRDLFIQEECFCLWNVSLEGQFLALDEPG